MDFPCGTFRELTECCLIVFAEQILHMKDVNHGIQYLRTTKVLLYYIIYLLVNSVPDISR
jgi:hypothetical protein